MDINIKWYMFKIRGLSSVELVVVVAIIGILIAAAIPLYKDYIKKGYTEARAAMRARYRCK